MDDELLSKFTKISIVAIIAYHAALAVLYGGYPSGIYPDEYWFIGNGLHLVGVEVPQGIETVAEKEIVLALFLGSLYRLFGFPLFLYISFLWNILVMLILIISGYLVGRQFFGKEVGLLAALLFGINWFIGWFGQRLVAEVGMIAFGLFGLALYGIWLNKRKAIYLVTSGIAFALSMWTRTSAYFVLLPMIIFILAELLKESRGISQLARNLGLIAAGFIILLFPFMWISYIGFGNPLASLIMRGSYGLGVLFKGFSIFYMTILLYALGLVSPLFFIGLTILIKKRKLLFPLWSLFPILIYMMVAWAYRVDYYVVECLPIALFVTAPGLNWLIKECINRFGRVGLLLPAVLMLSTNLSFYRKGSLIVFLHERLQLLPNKYEQIPELVQLTRSGEAEWWFAKLFYKSHGLDFNLLTSTALILAALLILLTGYIKYGKFFRNAASKLKKSLWK